MKVETLTAIAPPKFKRELQLLLDILNYQCKVSPVTAEICELLQKLTSVRSAWSGNKMCRDLYDKAKKIPKKDACIKFYDASRPLYLETDASGVSLGAG